MLAASASHWHFPCGALANTDTCDPQTVSRTPAQPPLALVVQSLICAEALPLRLPCCSAAIRA